MNNCLTCLKETKNPKFCSRSCSAITNNKLFPKGIPKDKFCTNCGVLYHNKWRKDAPIENSRYCKECRSLFKLERYRDKKIGEYWNLDSIKGKHPSWKNAHIRGICREWNKELTKLPCAKCGYKHHVELCHIKPITSFNEESTIGEINHKDNIIQLCRNCHWEFDHGLLKL